MRQENIPVSLIQQEICRFPIVYYSMPSYWGAQDYNVLDIFTPFHTQAFVSNTMETLGCVSQIVDSFSPMNFFTQGNTNGGISSSAEQLNDGDIRKFQNSQNQFDDAEKQLKNRKDQEYQKSKIKIKNSYYRSKKIQQAQLSEQSQDCSVKNYTNKLRQKFGRNIRSNIFHLMLNKFLKEESFDSKIQSIIEKFNLNFSRKQFKFVLNKKVKKLTSYISIKKMQQLNRSLNSMNTENGSSFALMFRILCRLYLSNEHIIHIYNSRKIKESSKRIHIRETRFLLNEIM